MTPSPSRSYDLLWLSLALLFLLPIALFLAVTPHDYWFYVRIGRDILETGAVPRADTFSYTYPGRPIFYQPWLSAVIFWWAHSLGGATLTFLLKGISIAFTYGLVWGLMRYAGTGTRLATLLLIFLGLSSSMNWSMRPQILAYPLFAVALWALWHWQRGQGKWMWTLPLITLLWVNLHGSFILAFVLMGSALVFGMGDRKQLILWFGISLFVTLINPRGVFRLAVRFGYADLSLRPAVCQRVASAGQCRLADEYFLRLAAAFYPSCRIIPASPVDPGMGLVFGFWMACAFGTSLRDLVHDHTVSAERGAVDGAIAVSPAGDGSPGCQSGI
jgi:hypothetical protein